MRLALAGILVILRCVRPVAQDGDIRETCFGLDHGLSGMFVHDVAFIDSTCYVTAEKGVFTFDGARFNRVFVFSDLSQRPRLVVKLDGGYGVVDRTGNIYRPDGSPTDLNYVGRLDGMPLCRRENDTRSYWVVRDGTPVPVHLPERTLLAATLEGDTLVSDGYRVMRLRAGRPEVLFGTVPADMYTNEAGSGITLLSARWFAGRVHDMLAHDDKIFVACGDGLYAYSPDGGFRLHRAGRDESSLSRLVSRDGMLFYVDANGVAVIDAHGDRGWSGKQIARASVTALAVRDGYVFMGTSDDGLCLAIPERLTLMKLDGAGGALGVARWQDTLFAARIAPSNCEVVYGGPGPGADGLAYLDAGNGVFAKACGQGTVFWDARGAFARYEASSMQFIEAGPSGDVYLGASRLVLRIPEASLAARRQVVPDTVRKTKGLTLVRVIGDSVFIGDEEEITLLAHGRETVYPFPTIREVVPVEEGLLFLGRGSPAWFVRPDGSVREVAWMHPTLAPAYFNASFSDGGITYFTADEGLYYVRSSMLKACLAGDAAVPLARITLAGRSTIEFNGGFSGPALKYKDDWYLPAINGVVRMRPLAPGEVRTAWRLTMSDGGDASVAATPGVTQVWRAPVLELGIAWDYLPEPGESLMQLSINGDVQYRGGLVRTAQFLLRRGLNRVEMTVFHPLLPEGHQTFTLLVDRRLPVLARVDFWIAVAGIILLAGLAGVAYSARRFRRIRQAHQGLLKDKAVLLEAWYANPGNHTAPRRENVLRSYMHDIEGGLKVSADTLKLLARPGNQSPEMLVQVAHGLEALLEICRRTSMEIIPPAHASDAPPQTVQKILESAVTHNQGYARAKAVDVIVRGDIRLPWKAAPELGRVLYVLVNNAIKFSLPGQQVVVSASVSGHVLNITVEDEGRGFRPEDKTAGQPSHIPASPGTSGEMGSGQGVYLAGRLVDEMGGVLSLAPRRNQPGTIATVTLPVA